MSFPHGLVPTDQRVHPTPIYELIAALVIAWILWRRGGKRNGERWEGHQAAGQLTAEYLILSGAARFLVEFIRINPPLYWGMTNAQVASLGSILAGILLLFWVRRHQSESPAPAALPVAAKGGSNH